MTKLLEIKDQLIRFYSKYETYLYPIVKFAVALTAPATTDVCVAIIRA